jgi:hypothetical protein
MTSDSGFTVTLQTTSRAEREAAAQLGPRAFLTFDFPADLCLPVGVQGLVDAFHAVMAQTTLRPDVARAILPLFLLGQVNGQHHLSDAAFLPLRNPSVSFRWPAFDKWRATFVEAGAYPTAWQGFSDGLGDRRRAFRDDAAGLLASTILSTAWMTFRAGQMRRTMQGPMASRHRLMLMVQDSNTAAFVRPFETALDLDDPGTLPPYFPGDTSSVQLDRKPASTPT